MTLDEVALRLDELSEETGNPELLALSEEVARISESIPEAPELTPGFVFYPNVGTNMTATFSGTVGGLA